MDIDLTMEELVDNFGYFKNQSDICKKKVDEFNKELKARLRDSDTKEAVSSEYRVKYSVATSRSFDEEKLLLKLKQLGANDCIKTVEVVDMKNLENAIYNKRIDAALLADCEKITQTEKLNLYKIKKEN